jgi:hypothetical protein
MYMHTFSFTYNSETNVSAYIIKKNANGDGKLFFKGIIFA